MSQNPPRWNQNLEGAPLAIASSVASPLRVLAGPGTGKTFSLMRRVARLLEGGAAPARIFVSTFTRTAATDLGNALAALGVAGVDEVETGTIHAHCFSILNRQAVLEATGRVPRPLLQFEERVLEGDLSEAGFGGIRVVRRQVAAFSAAWARLQHEIPGWPQDAADQAFQAGLLAWLRFHRAMLVGEIVPETLRYLQQNPACPERSAFDHVLVDEYQDLNRAEQALLDLLRGAGTFTLIGDEDQSIYSFKHAHPEGITTFPNTHPGTEDQSLQTCRRCPQTVVSIANSLIAKNTGRTPRTLDQHPGNGPGEVRIVQWTTMRDESVGLAEFIRRRIAAGTNPGSILVLSPRRQPGQALRENLTLQGVNAMSFFQEEAFDGQPMNDSENAAMRAFEVLTLLANPDDRVALRTWCGLGSPSLRAGAWQRLRAHCVASGESPRQALERLAAGTLTLTNVNELRAAYAVLQARLAQANGLVGDALRDFLFPAAQPWAAEFRGLSDNDMEPGLDAAGLHRILSSAITQPELPIDVDYVRVMSLHKSKGLTADLVVVIGCVEGLVPTLYGELTEAERSRMLQEQRRLFYVALTRAKSTLILSSFLKVEKADAYRMGIQVGFGFRRQVSTIASRFLAELGTSCPIPVTGAQLLA